MLPGNKQLPLVIYLDLMRNMPMRWDAIQLGSRAGPDRRAAAVRFEFDRVENCDRAECPVPEAIRHVRRIVEQELGIVPPDRD